MTRKSVSNPVNPSGPGGEPTARTSEWSIGKHESGDLLIHTDPASFAPPWAPREDTIAAVRGSHPQAEEFATLIVRAVNERSSLLEALREIERVGCMNRPGDEIWCKAHEHSVYCPAGIARRALSGEGGIVPKGAR